MQASPATEKVKIKEIAEYCESDVVNTYRMWLRYELFRGRLTEAANQASELNLVDFIKRHENTKQHLRGIAGLPPLEDLVRNTPAIADGS